MEHSVLTIGLPDELLSGLKKLVAQYRLCFTATPSIQEANYLIHRQAFHLIIADLEYLRSTHQTDWLVGIRWNTFAPIIVLSNLPERDMNRMIQLGADMCIPGKWPRSMIADLVYAQLRRYTEYDHRSDPGEIRLSAFREGDIYIDPARRKVEVRGQPVSLRPREFSLLLYFMRNPKIVLTAEQICEHAWEMEGSYNRGVSGPVF